MNFESGTITQQGQSFKPGTWTYEGIKRRPDCSSAEERLSVWRYVNSQLNSHKRTQRIENVGFWSVLSVSGNFCPLYMSATKLKARCSVHLQICLPLLPCLHRLQSTHEDHQA